jgi:hypothetical protein
VAVSSDRRIPIRVDRDIVAARQEGRAAALDLGLYLFVCSLFWDCL